MSMEACFEPECRTEHGCYCLKIWQSGGITNKGCPSTDKEGSEPSCWVADPDKCMGASMENGTSPPMKRDKCGITTTITTTLEPCGNTTDCLTNLGCVCLKTWYYKGLKHEGCGYTVDSEEPWCFVADHDRCLSLGAPESKTKPADVWDACPMGVETDHHCHCDLEWTYGGLTFRDCGGTVDFNESLWCYVREGGRCDGAVKTHRNGKYWDICGANTLSSTSAMVNTTTTTTAKCGGSGCITDHMCRCRRAWSHDDVMFEGCSFTEDFDDGPWCFVDDEDACVELGGTRSWTALGKVWDTCPMGNKTDHNCHCELSWSYGGAILNGCQQTSDQETPWCYIMDGSVCEGASLTNKSKMYWDTCGGSILTTSMPAIVLSTTPMPAATTTVVLLSTTTPMPASARCIEDDCKTKHNCWCKESWVYWGKTRQGCASTSDHWQKWCHVEDPDKCLAGSRSLADASVVWDTCGEEPPDAENACFDQNCITKHSCFCQKEWRYHGTKQSGCAFTADSPKPWCYVADKEHCNESGGRFALGNLGNVWDICPLGEETDHMCHCKIQWTYSNRTFSGCQRTPDHSVSWCYVMDASRCEGSIKTSKIGEYWDTCGGGGQQLLLEA